MQFAFNGTVPEVLESFAHGLRGALLERGYEELDDGKKARLVLNFIDRGLLSVVGPKLKPELGISDTMFGLLTGAGFAVFYTLVDPSLREAVIEIAEELSNTPTVCRTSYVHDAVIAAFEAGALKRPRNRKAKSPETQAELLARIVARHG